MSFILDALKKSEIERQRQTVPGLMDTRSAPRRNRLPLWAVILGCLLGVNLIVLGYVLTRSNSPANVAGIAPRAEARPRPDAPLNEAASGGAAQPTLSTPFSPLDAAPVYAPEIPVPASAPVTAPSEPPAVSAPRTSISAFGTAPQHPVRHADPVLSDDAKSDDEVLPTINEINLTGPQALPEIHLDVHVYATKPAERFVFINMRKYHEGATLQEGPTIERIRRDGVILNYFGLRFLLPRQS